LAFAFALPFFFARHPSLLFFLTEKGKAEKKGKGKGQEKKGLGEIKKEKTKSDVLGIF